MPLSKPKSIAPTGKKQLEQAIEGLAQSKVRWQKTSHDTRIQYLEVCLERLRLAAPKWVHSAALAKGLEPGSATSGEEWFLGPVITARHLRLLIHTLGSKGKPSHKYFRREEGRTKVGVFPLGLWESILWLGVSAELWLQPGAPETQGSELHQASQVGLVLGAGNVASIPSTDVLHKLFVENQVVLLKMNPVNDYLGPIIADVFEPLVKEGFLAVVYGGAEVGALACQAPKVETIHITGSQHTHDQIVWGGDKQGSKPIEKAISSELGCVTPVLVVPGPWSEKQLRYQARHVVAMKVYNAGFNCVAAQVILTSRSWPLRERFLDLLEEELGRVKARSPYYPGAEERRENFSRELDQALAPHWTFVRDIPHDSKALQEEAFCGAFAEVALETEGPADFLLQATDFANQKIWGNLSANILIHPHTQGAYRAAFERSLGELAYGTIGVNLWSGVCFGLITPPWGAYPGNSLENISSGRGFVHNTLLFDHPEKTVVTGMFTTPYLPPWIHNNQGLEELGRRMFDFEAKPGFLNLFRALWAVAKGTWRSS